MRAVVVAANDDAPADARGAAGLFRQLQVDTVEADGVVGRDHALGLGAEDLIEIDVAERHKGRCGIRGGPGEGGVVVGDEPLAQIGVGGRGGGDAGQAKFVNEAVLQRAIEPLAPPAGLRRVGADVLDAEAGEGAPTCVSRSRSMGPPAVGV